MEKNYEKKDVFSLKRVGERRETMKSKAKQLNKTKEETHVFLQMGFVEIELLVYLNSSMFVRYPGCKAEFGPFYDSKAGRN